jgi:hypothetical protein
MPMKSIHAMADAVKKYTLVSYVDGDCSIAPPPNPDSKTILTEICHGDPPAELEEFYAFCDGIGYLEQGHKGDIRWEIPKITALAYLLENAQQWYSKNHPELVSRFLPIMDDDGDYSGYLRNTDGTWQDCLYCFWHEDYLFDDNQPVDDFLFCLDEGLVEYLISESE